jgi:type II restriction/modification system DNA methylase subunit YeeA
MWIIDFGVSTPMHDAALYEAPFEYVSERVRPTRLGNKREAYVTHWWLHVEPRSGMRAALAGLPRFIATVRHSKHRLFVWLPAGTLPDSALIAFARDDDYTFGVLHGRAHELWARATGTQVREAESGFRYTPTTCFETFPFPDPSEAQRRAIADAAQDLDQLRTGWLNPHGQPEAELRERTLTHLYNARPAWLAQAHERLDRAVFDAYGWVDQPSDEEILRRLLDLNLAHLAA